jgi:hypothetical protein
MLQLFLMPSDYSGSRSECHPIKNATFDFHKRREENNYNSTTTNYFTLQIERWYEIQ